MKVQLTQDVIQGGTLKVSYRKTGAVPYTKGTIIEMSDTSAEKYVKEGLGVYVEEPKEVSNERQATTGTPGTERNSASNTPREDKGKGRR